MPLRRLALCFLLALHLHAQGAHPEIRAIIFEALELAKDVRDSQQSHAAKLLARAGYLDDSEKIVRQYDLERSFPPYYLWKAWVIYGQQQRMDQHLTTLKDPKEKVTMLNAYANHLWRLGQKAKAKQTYLAAQALLPRVTDPRTRTNATNFVTQGLKYVDDDAPTPLLVQTKPLPKRKAIPVLSERFPITPNTFTKQQAADREANSLDDERLIRELYASLKAGDRQALDRVVSSAATPFQKAMILASVQHIMNQAKLADLSEVCAKSIPTTNVDTKLARAEALASAATSLAINGAKNRARALFLEATQLVSTITELPLARIQVFINITLRQYDAGFDSDGNDTWIRALAIAQTFPHAPTIWNERRRVTYSEDAYDPMIRAAVEFDRLPLATQAISTWSATYKGATGSLVSALLSADEHRLALSTARSIQDRHMRADELLSVASSWLDDSGVPDL